MKWPDRTGHRYNRWTVLRFQRCNAQGKRYWLCRCSCGTVKSVSDYHLHTGATKSCGCYRIEKSTYLHVTHGRAGTSLYRTFIGMLTRCYNSNELTYHSYGGRGIKVCKRWRGKNGFINFLADMGERPTARHSIERINNNKGYSPANCKWATTKEQSRNRQKTIYVNWNGGKYPLVDACKELGLPYATVYQRIKILKWPARKALEL